MILRLNVDVMKANLEVLKRFAEGKGVGLALMMKYQFWADFMSELLEGEQVYTNRDMKGWENIYTSERVVVVDAFDRREGLTIEQAKGVVCKDVAIVNFYCCNGKIPLESDLSDIACRLYAIGFNKVSFGGSLLLDYRNIAGDEIRVGEALLTGYLSEPYSGYFAGMSNPFEVDLEVWSSSRDGVVVRYGFMDIGGFTNVGVKCCNTDFSVLNLRYNGWKDYKKGDLITLKPDYFTLIRLVDKWGMQNVELA